jgi:hypothetical protein
MQKGCQARTHRGVPVQVNLAEVVKKKDVIARSEAMKQSDILV